MDIKGFENYTIDLYGNVYSKKRKKFLKQSFHKGERKGYFQISLKKNGKKHTIDIHRLMAMTYLPNIYNKSLVDHKNRNRTDNRLFNLCWVSYAENAQNRNKHKNNTTGFKNITYRVNKNRANQYLLEITRNGKCIARECKSVTQWSLQDIVEMRNKYYLEFNIPITD